jgi:hypothetical protein
LEAAGQASERKTLVKVLERRPELLEDTVRLEDAMLRVVDRTLDLPG